MQEQLHWKPVWTVTHFETRADYEAGRAAWEASFGPNQLLNEGINLAWSLICGGAGTAFDNANSYLGVGDSSAAESASQTGLQAAVNTAYAGMEDGYPSVTDQAITWRAVFGADAANFDWREFSVGNADAGAGDNLNRKVDNQGTKASGQVWTLDLQITLS